MTRPILVVTEHLIQPSLRSDDRFGVDVVDGLVRLVGAEALSVMVLDGHLADRAADSMRARGVEVLTGPADWAGWLFARWGDFSHVFVTRSALDSPVLSWLDDSQPSAARVVCVDHISSRATRSRRAFVDLGESEGVELLAELSERHLLDALDGFDASLCATGTDVDWMAASTGRPAYLVGPRFAVAPLDPPFSRRAGVAVFASGSYDISAGAEDAALMSIDAVAQLRATNPKLAVSVIAQRLSPRLKRAAASVDAQLVDEADAAACLAFCRVALVAGRYGTAATGPLLAAIDARTPILATSAVASAAGVDLMAEPWYSDSPPSLAAHARRLLSDEAFWLRYHDSIDRFARSHPVDPPGRTGPLDEVGPLDGLRSVLVDLGIDAYARLDAATPGPGAPPAYTPMPARASSPGQSPPLRPGGPALRPGGPAVGLADVDSNSRHPEDPDARYRLWQLAHTPTPDVLEAIASDAVSRANPPTVSIVVAGGADPKALAESIDSVGSQVYPHWQLCVAYDPAAPGADTVTASLQALQGDRVRALHVNDAMTDAAASKAAFALATGEYVSFIEAGGVLTAHAIAQVARWVGDDPTLDVLYTDDDRIGDPRQSAAGDPGQGGQRHAGRSRGSRVEVHVKPDWSPDLLMSTNYIANLAVYRRSLVDAAGGIREGMGAAAGYDLALRVTELTERVGHIPEPLYSARKGRGGEPGEEPATATADDPSVLALSDALARRGTPGSVEQGAAPGTYRVRYAIPGSPKVSIIIPIHNGVDLLRACVESIWERSTYRHYEIVVLDNRSDDGETLSYLAKAPLRVLRYPQPFNYARQMNLAAASCAADALVFLNNDTVVITPEWLEALLEHAMRPEVGAVGCRLYYPDGRVQHEGILSGTVGWAWNIDHQGYFARGDVVRNASSVTGAATMTRPGVFGRVGGNDEDLRIAYNDVDLGERIRQAGYRIVYTPHAELYHCEGGTRGRWEHPDDGVRFGARWEPRTHVDPYYSPLFQRDRPFVLAV